MIRACLTSGAHYLDITGEIAVFQNAYCYHDAARDKNIAIIPGVGFDVIPSDCLIKYVADQLPDATHLEIALDALGAANTGMNISAGTAKSILGFLPALGNLVRRDGNIVSIPFGSGARQFRFQGGERWAMPVPWGDLEVGYRTAGIPNITTYLTFPRPMIAATRLVGGGLRALLKIGAVRGAAGKLVERMFPGPSESVREAGRSFIYARVSNPKGESRQAWLETLEGYQFTVLAAPLVVERILDSQIKGATTPALALGADFPLTLVGTTRLDTLP
jgi:short subunit dehydrogenase-like uncharacterized protein